MTGLRALYRRFPQKFWIVVGVHFVDKIGGTLAFPFFSLYVTGKFGVGMTDAGILLGILAGSSIVGSVVGGGLTDRLGRRRLILFGLVFSALSALALGLVNDFRLLYPLAVFVGLLSDVGAPAHAAMIADILPKERRQEGFGVLRVVGNMAWLVGPTVGGFVARRSFFAIFAIDAAISLVVALLFYVLMPETRPEPHPDDHETMATTFRNYQVVLRDRAFVSFLVACILMGVVYVQMYNSLSVYLRDQYGLPPQAYGFLLTASAITVILCQIWVMRIIARRPPFAMMALGSLFYMIGFGMFGVFSTYTWFVTAIVVVTIGEMIAIPTSQALAAHFAPVDMRGRYMAVFDLNHKVPAMIGPAAAGVVLDYYVAAWLWYIGAATCLLAALAFLALQMKLGYDDRFASKPAAAPTVA